ncbi:HesB/YadR/YfhF family protein [Sutcliffiella cohnii]|uniref:Core domain-containing protein n=1 Tax=Sutcliffiella cohnii TaxID=33932 RepID=A0A223KRH2_9BACI|nr:MULTISPECIES: HesB/YadR/YfhF family protein [Sutcliffiella]AST91948.1 hypothetical protein BC6307_12025 [Sutcliffiella cohnii]MED4015225.1 HesB/YadR/YfhF family protein [Sutcliffiella cohnii]WBL13188.1 HesB/YadR/YfhF family protein [Sutcliffiella sp. NC1]
MQIKLEKEAFDWYKEELDLHTGDSLRFHVRYGGCSNIQKGFSLGIEKEKPESPIAKVEIDGITFYVEEKEAWYFEGHDLVISYDSKLDEPVFNYE